MSCRETKIKLISGDLNVTRTYHLEQTTNMTQVNTYLANKKHTVRARIVKLDRPLIYTPFLDSTITH